MEAKYCEERERVRKYQTCMNGGKKGCNECVVRTFHLPKRYHLLAVQHFCMLKRRDSIRRLDNEPFFCVTRSSQEGRVVNETGVPARINHTHTHHVYVVGENIADMCTDT